MVPSTTGVVLVVALPPGPVAVTVMVMVMVTGTSCSSRAKGAFSVKGWAATCQVRSRVPPAYG